MWSYIAIAIIIILIFYISYYYRYPAELSILQTTLGEFHFDMLREKQPIVIQDRVTTLASLSSMWFGANFTTQFATPPSDDAANPVWIRNKYKYVVIQSQSDDCEILLASARAALDPQTNGPSEDTTVIAIQLAADQIVVIPFHMLYAIANRDKKEVYAIGVHDVITKVLP